MLASALVRDRKSMDYGRKEKRYSYDHTQQQQSLNLPLYVLREKLILISYSQRRGRRKQQCTLGNKMNLKCLLKQSLIKNLAASMNCTHILHLLQRSHLGEEAICYKN